MAWTKWWQLLFVLSVRSLAQPNAPTMCEENACHCDSFTRVICNCTLGFDELTLRPDGAFRVPITATGIIINGCARVQFLPDTVRNLIQLRNVEIRNVGHLVITERALSWPPIEGNPGIRILIHNSTVNEISSYAIQGGVNTIQISESRLMSIRPFAFSSLNSVTNIELIDNEFSNIDIQTFKKFTVNNFLLRGGFIGTLPSRFLSDVEVTNVFRFEGVTVMYVFSLSFLVSGPQRVYVEGCSIGTLEGDGFRMVTRGPITFRNNKITALRKGAFLGFSVHAEVTSVKGQQELLIENNTITEMIPASLAFNRDSLSMRLEGLNYNITCACELAEEWRDLLKEPDSTINCWYELEGRFVSLTAYLNSRCGPMKRTFWIFVVVGIVIILIVAAIVVCCIIKREKAKKAKVQIVMPDGKTYRETEFHIVVERAELLTTDL